MALGWLLVAEQQRVNEEELNRPPLPSIENASKPNDHIDIWPQSTCRHSSGPSVHQVWTVNLICQPIGSKESQHHHQCTAQVHRGPNPFVLVLIYQGSAVPLVQPEKLVFLRRRKGVRAAVGRPMWFFFPFAFDPEIN